MAQEEKQILLKDLCGRIPCGVKVKYLYWDENKGCEYPVPMILDDINSDGYIRFHGDIAEGEGRGMLTQYLPYLRPMSSMTEEEKKTFTKLKQMSVTVIIPNHATVFRPDYIVDLDDEGDGLNSLYDWLNAHHFDYRGLIGAGLALEAPEGMYVFES